VILSERPKTTNNFYKNVAGHRQSENTVP
jgi:hypothetical protein